MNPDDDARAAFDAGRGGEYDHNTLAGVLLDSLGRITRWERTAPRKVAALAGAAEALDRMADHVPDAETFDRPDSQLREVGDLNIGAAELDAYRSAFRFAWNVARRTLARFDPEPDNAAEVLHAFAASCVVTAERLAAMIDGGQNDEEGGDAS